MLISDVQAALVGMKNEIKAVPKLRYARFNFFHRLDKPFIAQCEAINKQIDRLLEQIASYAENTQASRRVLSTIHEALQKFCFQQGELKNLIELNLIIYFYQKTFQYAYAATKVDKNVSNENSSFPVLS